MRKANTAQGIERSAKLKALAVENNQLCIKMYGAIVSYIHSTVELRLQERKELGV
jgi:hypothetical protein